jgi:hypothetical protein
MLARSFAQSKKPLARSGFFKKLRNGYDDTPAPACGWFVVAVAAAASFRIR